MFVHESRQYSSEVLNHATQSTTWHGNCHTHTSRGNNTSFRRALSRIIILSTVLTFFAMTIPLHAQTEWKDRYVTLAENDQIEPAIARPAQDAFTVIVWEDYRNGESDIYAQMIDNNSGLPMWSPPDGVPVCTAVGEQRNPVASYDTLNGVIITWEDYRTRMYAPIVDSTAREIYAHRLSLTDGSCDPVWILHQAAWQSQQTRTQLHVTYASPAHRKERTLFGRTTGIPRAIRTSTIVMSTFSTFSVRQRLGPWAVPG